MTISSRPNDLLLLVGKALAIFMQVVMAIAAVALVIAAGALLIFSGEIAAEAAAEFGDDVGALPGLALAGIMLVGLAIVAALYFFFDRLRRIINTVGDGDPFLPENANRLNLMAWLLLSVHLLTVPAIGLALFLSKWADQVDNANITVDAGLDLSGILMVIVLFILARVFRIGAAMREDLEGTV
ncbi:DUF2975 domain-containing protein [Aurantiacibacter marinus]|uniref:DUF2975 domain-containing protein n=1 Tax=Aurantiacibacter marinus TaxID=874156 RepID=A0A0H0XSG8_9SPHN|nr:DUF2975 domain-containing protein [Aurantiacibacter marinus]KLI64931.1 hypothetical protein AAV99_05400 [Aurantiacibacter marinus]